MRELRAGCGHGLEGLNVVKIGRVMLGETDPAESKSSTVRRDCGVQVGRNIMDSSDSVKKC